MSTRFMHRLLDDLQYPVRRDEVLLHARLKEVGSDLIELLSLLPHTTFYSCQDIIRELPLRRFEQRMYQYL